jgi:hypothetical protein
VRRTLLALVLAALLVPAAARLVRRRRRTRSGDGDAAYREVVDTMVDLQLGSEASTPRTTVSAAQALVETGAGPGPGSGDVHEALTRILRAVEWQRYGSPEARSTGPAAEPGATAGPGAAAGGVMLAERQVAAHSGLRPGALTGDIRMVRRALARRAGWVRRAVAVLMPRSVLTGLAARAANRGGAGAG